LFLLSVMYIINTLLQKMIKDIIYSPYYSSLWGVYFQTKYIVRLKYLRYRARLFIFRMELNRIFSLSKEAFREELYMSYMSDQIL
jgi:hypothetical protein